MKKRRLWWVAGIVLALTFTLAFPLREWTQRAVITPLAVILWGLNLFYRSMPQLLWWVILTTVVITMAVGSLAPPEIFTPRERDRARPSHGPVESLSQEIKKTRDGAYFKWMIANRLGRLAYQMLVQREGGNKRSAFAPLVGVDWQPSRGLQKYLEVGLHGSFAEYPTSETLRHGSSPLDVEIREAVEFLEEHLETGSH
ncbi:MAG: hypothetical protein ACOY0R_06565 [Chloroflexota bacterium]